MRKSMFFLVLALCLLPVGGCGGNDREAVASSEKQPRAKWSPETLSVSVGDHVELVPIPAALVPSDETSVAAETAGRVLSVNVKRGDTVTPGDIVAVLDTSLLDAGLRSAVAQASLSTRQLEREKRLFAEKVVSKDEYDQAKTRAELDRATVDDLRTQISKATIRTRVGGYVQSVPVDEGEYASPGTVLSTVIDTSELKAVFGVPQRVPLPKPGDKVDLVLDDGGKIASTVTFVSLDSETAGRVWTVEAAVDGGSVRAGTYVLAMLPAQTASGAFVPASSLGKDSGTSAVAVIDGGVVSHRPVTPLFHQGEGAIVAGLPDGERILRFFGELPEGAEVEE